MLAHRGITHRVAPVDQPFLQFIIDALQAGWSSRKFSGPLERAVSASVSP